MKKYYIDFRNFVNENRWAIFSIAVLSVVVYLGFSVKMYKINQCNSTVTKYVTAEFSDITFSVDSEGNSTTSTDYWSEPASEVNSITVYNELPEYPPMPEHDTSATGDYGFDNFKFHTDAKTHVYASVPGESTHFTVHISKAGKCLKKIDDVAIVKTWYTMTYDSNF